MSDPAQGAGLTKERGRLFLDHASPVDVTLGVSHPPAQQQRSTEVVRLAQVAADCRCLIEKIGCLVPVHVMLFDLGKVVQRRRASTGITDGVPDGQCLLAERGGRLDIPHGNREDGGPVQRVAFGRAGGRPGCRQGVVQPRRALTQVPPRVPVRGTGRGESQAFLDGTSITEPIACGAEIVVVGGKAIEPSDWRRRTTWLALFGEGEKIRRVVAADLVELAALRRVVPAPARAPSPAS